MRLERKKVGKQFKISAFCSLFVAVLLAVLLGIKGRQLTEESKAYAATKEKLEAEIIEQEEEAKEIEELEKYVQTKKYIEETAREKLGLVYPDEIIIKSK